MQGKNSNIYQFVNCFFLVDELVPRVSRPARPVSVPAPEMRDRADSGSQSTSPAKGMKSIKGKLMARPRTRPKVDYDELAQVNYVNRNPNFVLVGLCLACRKV